MQFLQVSALCNPLMSRNACNGENGETGEKSPASGDLNWMPKVAPWRLAILAKMTIVAELAILAKIARNACNGVNGKKLPASGNLNWMPKVRIHCLLYFNLAFFLRILRFSSNFVIRCDLRSIVQNRPIMQHQMACFYHQNLAHSQIQSTRFMTDTVKRDLAGVSLGISSS